MKKLQQTIRFINYSSQKDLVNQISKYKCATGKPVTLIPLHEEGCCTIKFFEEV